MKKRILLIATAILLGLFVVGCTSDKTASKSSDNQKVTKTDSNSNGETETKTASATDSKKAPIKWVDPSTADFNFREAVSKDFMEANDNMQGANLQAEGIVITGYTGHDSQIRIPDIINGKPITAIAQDAFNGCALEAVYIPDSVKLIKRTAFAYSKKLAYVRLSDNLKIIEWDAFKECESLESISFPNSLMGMFGDTFWGCKSLTKLVIPNNITVIASAFINCVGLTDVSIGDGITALTNTFAGCTGLKNITIGKNVTEIREGAFASCKALESVTIPPSVKRINGSAFDNCLSLDAQTKTRIREVNPNYTFK